MDDDVKAEVMDIGGNGGGGFEYEMVLRAVAFCLTLVAAVVAGVDYQTQTIPITISDSLAPLTIQVTAKWHYLSSSVFFVVANSMACCYSFASLILSMNKKIKTRLPLPLMISDLVMVALLFSANGAATAVGVIGLNGNSHTQWQKVCYIFKRYCHQGAASIVISFLGSFAFLWLVVFAILNLHKKSN
ncbi:hypothetical protein L6452_43315 [Arctium lappa]|uniref:Uncharacterized protein n=1 Tax=Arctium lappa TaxID=4217 RepID=A0ACB8XLH1_ARCLA|nr:hypothetical protein L6452_43315 [Arctium lappa]